MPRRNVFRGKIISPAEKSDGRDNKSSFEEV
jgi:hypothetical protein